MIVNEKINKEKVFLIRVALMIETYIGEWWNADPEAVIAQALQTGAGPNVSDAYTFNGLPGPLYNCSNNGNSFV